MSQHGFSVPNQSRSAYRADVNLALQALVRQSSGTSAPASTYEYQRWADTTNGVMKQRNAANSLWIIRDTLAETLVVARSSNTIIALGDYGRTFIATSTYTQTLTAAATLGDGWHCWYRNDGAGVITLDPNASETIDGATTLALNPGDACRIACNGSEFKTQGLTLRATPITNSLSSNVALNNSSNYFTGPSVAQGTTGKWFVTGKVVVAAASSSDFQAKLWDGTTVIDSASVSEAAANQQLAISLSGVITNPAGDLRISCKDSTGTDGNIYFNLSGNSKDSTITAFRIG